LDNKIRSSKSILHNKPSDVETRPNSVSMKNKASSSAQQVKSVQSKKQALDMLLKQIAKKKDEVGQ